jgi:hypothetical protein
VHVTTAGSLESPCVTDEDDSSLQAPSPSSLMLSKRRPSSDGVAASRGGARGRAEPDAPTTLGEGIVPMYVGTVLCVAFRCAIEAVQKGQWLHAERRERRGKGTVRPHAHRRAHTNQHTARRIRQCACVPISSRALCLSRLCLLSPLLLCVVHPAGRRFLGGTEHAQHHSTPAGDRHKHMHTQENDWDSREHTVCEVSACAALSWCQSLHPKKMN